jgi:hypothetical protein
MAFRSFERFRQASTHLDTPPFPQNHHPVSAIAHLVEIHITRKGFEPHQVELRRNQPAILRIANADDRPRVFNAPKFFPAVALGNITVDDQPIAELCPDAIDVPPNSILDIAVIPLQSGRFPFGGPDIPIKSWGSGLAVMYVEGILIVK